MHDYYKKTNNKKGADEITAYIIEANKTKKILEGNSYDSYQQLNSNINNLSLLFSSIEEGYSANLSYVYIHGRYHIFRNNKITKELAKKINASIEIENQGIAAIIKEPTIALIKENCELIRSLKEEIENINASAEKDLNENYAYLAANASFQNALGLYKENLIIEVDNSIIRDVYESANESLYRFMAQKKAAPIPLINAFFENISESGFYALVKLGFPDELDEYEKQYCSRINESFNLSVKIESVNASYMEYDFGNLSSDIAIDLPYNNPRCCISNNCADCCLSQECLKESKNYPIMFVHGHAFRKVSSPEQSLDRFTDIQRRLQDEGYVNAGQIDLKSGEEDIPYGDWGKFDLPLTLRGSFYYVRFYDFGKYAITTEKSESIENYAVRLKELIELVKYRTGKEKVNIIAHSMGGLTVRYYISLFGENDINKVIMISTPNKGIKESINRYCAITGSKKECNEMAENSILMKRLNAPGKIPKNVKFYNIIGVGCDIDGFDGDGVVVKENAALDYAENIYIKGECPDFFGTELHNKIVEYPETYENILEILEKE